MSTVLTTSEDLLHRLASFESPSDPVISLYLNLRVDQHGRRRHEEFFERAFHEQMETFGSLSAARRKLEQDFETIRRFLQTGLRPTAQTAAVFSCSAAPPLFETVQLDVPSDGHRLYIDRRPHLFPLARLNDQYAKYAALLVDTNAARLYVFAVGAAQRMLTLQNEKPRRTPGVDVFSEGEYQRNAENLHLMHMKEVAAAVERVVREEHVQHVFVSANPVALPLLRDQLPDPVAAKVIELSKLDMNTPDAEVLRATLDAYREIDVRDDRDAVARVLDAFRSRGLGTIGLQRVKAALTLGQVDRLLVPAVPARASADVLSADVTAAADWNDRTSLSEAVIEQLVQMAHQTGAGVTFIEDSAVLKPAGDVAAFLRFRLTDPEAGRE